MSDNVIFLSKNIAIARANSSSCLLPSSLSVQDLSGFYGTVSLPVAQSKSTIEDKMLAVKSLFGSWLESGDEDRKLEEIYNSRSIPSSTFHE